MQAKIDNQNSKENHKNQIKLKKIKKNARAEGGV